MASLLELDLLAKWKVLCEDPRYNGIQHKVELTGTGKIIMSPVNNNHSLLQGIVFRTLTRLLPDWLGGPEFAIQTSDGIRAADIAFFSPETHAKFAGEFVTSIAPDICVEIMSPSNTLSEMEEKRTLYFGAGCREFILVDRKGFVTFYAPEGQLDASVLAPDFPARLPLK